MNSNQLIDRPLNTDRMAPDIAKINYFPMTVLRRLCERNAF